MLAGVKRLLSPCQQGEQKKKKPSMKAVLQCQ